MLFCVSYCLHVSLDVKRAIDVMIYGMNVGSVAALGVSERVIIYVYVARGFSLPFLFTSILE